ncbi:uncharacterized protein LOC105905278 [Clupea harengus]|uniref:Uncharacterized protein LOC105905278 n=1 Tax=Clupea harengus TaxID=7950 RepID=A0A6P8FBB9_CLUHA|nr:uncharacterized protein LOC105905278 [Clupea harengus]XP_031420499.1 uncharacterized protein LOC105905278 [Clupea harengus]
MGRLDDAAKRKVVELREAGLSFRKIKAVLELENIKVSAQAIYLFLKEFNGRNGTNLAAGGAGVQANMGESSTGSRNNSWRDQLQLGTLMREASRVAGYSTSPDPPQQGGSSSEERGIKGVRKEDEEEDIRIVSVTSLAQRSPQDGVHTQRTSMTTGVGAMTGIFARRRLTVSPATNPVLLARKRLLDKALLHRARIREGAPSPGQQVATPTRRDQSWRNMMLPQVASSIDLTTTRPQQVRRIVDGHPDVRRGFQPRMGVPTPPRVGVRLPSPAAPNTTTQAVANPNIRIQHPANQPQRREPSPNYQPGVLEALRQGLGEQVQGLGSEVRSLGLAVRMLVEQQSRLEREQVQQTQVQKQILSTLQFLASRPGPCALTHAPTPTPPSPASLAAVSSYGQSTFTSTQGSYTQASLALSESSVLENAEAFSLSGMSSAGMNGFSGSESLQPAHTHTSPAYSQSLTHTHTPLDFTQTPVHSHTQTHSPILHQNQGLSHTDSFEDSKDTEFLAGQVDGNLQDYRPSIPGISPLSLSPQEPQLNIIKVEAD